MPKHVLTPALAFRASGKELRAYGPRSASYACAQAELARREAKRAHVTAEVDPMAELTALAAPPARIMPTPEELAEAGLQFLFELATPRDLARLWDEVQSV